MPSETVQRFEPMHFKSEEHEAIKFSIIPTKGLTDDTSPTPTFLFHCKSEPDSFYDSSMLEKQPTSPHTGESQNGLLVNGPVGANLMLFMSDECNANSEAAAMESHNAFSPCSSDVGSPMSTTCSSAFSPDSPTTSHDSGSPTHESSRDNELLLFDEDTISSLASILEESNDMHCNSTTERTLKCARTSMAHSPCSPEAQVPSSPANQQPSVFNFGLATANPQFMETNFSNSTIHETNEVTTTSTRSSGRSKPKKSTDTTQSGHDVIMPQQRKTSRTRNKKTPNLNLSLPSKLNGVQLSINVQPEKQHRARYLTEGSRGSVKDESQEGFPSLRLTGINETVTLQVFVAADLPNRVKPHGYYQACKVTGRNTTPCSEIDVEGTTMIEIQWKPSDDEEDMGIRLDCVGILKLRNADVEKRIGLMRSKRKSTAVRLVFRVNVERPDNTSFTLQQVSSSICCTQPLGHPEIIKKSLTRCTTEGGEELFIIGKNFVNKHTSVKLQEIDASGAVSWEEDCVIDKPLFHNTHIVCTTPKFHTVRDLDRDAEVYLVVSSGPGKTSEQFGHPMYYYSAGVGTDKQNHECNISSTAMASPTSTEGTMQIDLTSLDVSVTHDESSMDSTPMMAMDVLNSLSGQAAQRNNVTTASPLQVAMQQLQPSTMASQFRVGTTTSQLQPTFTLLQPVCSPTQTTSSIQPMRSPSQITSSICTPMRTTSSICAPMQTTMSIEQAMSQAQTTTTQITQLPTASTQVQHVQLSAAATIQPLTMPAPTIATTQVSALESLTTHLQQATSHISTAANTQLQPSTTEILPVTTQLQSVATRLQSATTQLQPDATQLQPVTTQLQPVTTQFQPVTTQFQPVTTQFQPVTTQFQPVTTQFQPATMQSPAVTSQFQPVTTTQFQPGNTQLQSLLTPASSPKSTISTPPTFTVMDSLNQLKSQRTMDTTPQLSIASLLQQIPQQQQQQQLQQQHQQQQQQQLQQQLQQVQQLQQQQQAQQLLQQQQQQQQSQLLPAETLLQAAKSLQALQAQAVQMQALQPQVQAAALQVSAQLQLHAQKLQQQLTQKQEQEKIIEITKTQSNPSQQIAQQQQQQNPAACEVTFADKLKAAAHLEVSQPGLLTKLAQQQNLMQTRTPVTIHLPPMPTVPTVLNLQ